MKRYFIALWVCIICSISVSAQVGEAVVEFNKTKRTVKSMEVSDAPDVVEQAIKNKMLKLGYKAKTNKGWMEFKDVDDRSIAGERSDLYIKVERKSRKDKETSLVYFFASKPGNQATPVPFESNMLSEDGFYSNIVSYTVAERLERDIRAQEDITKKAQKKYDDLVKDQASLEKKIRDFQNDLEDNKKKQEAQVQEVESQRKILDQLLSKRNSQ
ncbi:hypothetical protein [Agriterribacter sp.]|uniref:hypothetical protein n=1 Tax=Agriterribacter sp. TaxID=2821509 RepID=UPI002C7A6674|nr:hypothetical protein [Agriterribacter sp.]HRO47590.1 hypothetical protein [Agriterribacter sp.]HRQ18701.1 hypothetical protein [Agriterribacter sp.]